MTAQDRPPPPPGPPPARRNRTLTERAVEKLRRNILMGVYQPDTHLQEIPVAEELAMSRTPVREALSTLASEGLLVHAPKRGYSVRRFSMREVVEAYSVRSTLEGMAARVLAERGIDEATQIELATLLGEVDALLAARKLNVADRDPWRRANIRFHGLLHETTDNRFLTKSLSLVQNIPLVSNAIIQWYDYDSVRRYHDDHHAIVQAIIRRESARAEALMREHIHQACLFVTQRLGEDDRLQP
ncbi:MAG: GntR family transcriptional regulator [Rhodobacteraceae bacterium]|nr:GntR family transcriptional regulator [Paracoccaceae bacterium]